MTDKIPIFPLNTVLFPDEELPLRIFEPRYIDMVGECLRNNAGFGVCLIKEGREVGRTAKPFDLGTYARIIDWDQNPDGILGINVVGCQRFRIIDTSTKSNHLLEAEVEWITDGKSLELPEEFYPLQELLTQLIDQLNLDLPKESGELDDAMWVSYRLAELFPFDMHLKQEILEIDDDIQRLERLLKLINDTIESDQLH